MVEMEVRELKDRLPEILLEKLRDEGDQQTLEIMEKYLRDCDECQQLSLQQIEALAATHPEGEDGKKLIGALLKDVVVIAMSYMEQRTFPFIDLIQEGNIGLIRALERYDPSEGEFYPFFVKMVREDIEHILNGPSFREVFFRPEMMPEKETVLSDDEIEKLRAMPEILTQRERKVFEMLSEGMSTEEIAADMVVTKRLINLIMKRIRMKLLRAEELE
ncbi:MAG: sigma-70 family RNA polymerase sigma factor [Erysipelotrichaceae bacterium]|nr:sigma-70 family RNA polymerase sigma factor [Erysipelotrichaceae bacterium]